jgi:hypothetical protein
MFIHFKQFCSDIMKKIISFSRVCQQRSIPVEEGQAPSCLRNTVCVSRPEPAKSDVARLWTAIFLFAQHIQEHSQYEREGGCILPLCIYLYACAGVYLPVYQNFGSSTIDPIPSKQFSPKIKNNLLSFPKTLRLC